MDYSGNKDFFIQVQAGNVPGASMVHKFGRNAAVPNGSWEFVNNLGFSGWPLAATTAVRVKAGGNAADTAAGDGARSITVQGIDANGDETSETVATAGASASTATTTTFWRVHRAWVSEVGVYGAANTAAITIETATGSADLLQIAVGEGQSQFAGYTVPRGKTAQLLSVHLTVDAKKAGDFRVFTRNDITTATAPMAAKRLKLFFDGVLGSTQYAPRGPEMVLQPLTDIWVEAEGSGNDTEASADFELLLIDV